ncbi:MAG TPA: CopG family transcriptional regulator [Acidimicrobiia bacterium]|nr:CopG family transcriptional regulator [Acidimicrobiia bacterium]
MAVRKWSVSVEEDLARRVEEHVGDRGLSGFVARAVEHQLEREALAEYLDELDEAFGPIPDELVAEYDGSWPS